MKDVVWAYTSHYTQGYLPVEGCVFFQVHQLGCYLAYLVRVHRRWAHYWFSPDSLSAWYCSQVIIRPSGSWTNVILIGVLRLSDTFERSVTITQDFFTPSSYTWSTYLNFRSIDKFLVSCHIYFCFWLVIEYVMAVEDMNSICILWSSARASLYESYNNTLL